MHVLVEAQIGIVVVVAVAEMELLLTRLARAKMGVVEVV